MGLKLTGNHTQPKKQQKTWKLKERKAEEQVQTESVKDSLEDTNSVRWKSFVEKTGFEPEVNEGMIDGASSQDGELARFEWTVYK